MPVEGEDGVYGEGGHVAQHNLAHQLLPPPERQKRELTSVRKEAGLRGSGSELDPESIESLDPDPYSESESGSKRAKMTHRSRRK